MSRELEVGDTVTLDWDGLDERKLYTVEGFYCSDHDVAIKDNTTNEVQVVNIELVTRIYVEQIIAVVKANIEAGGSLYRAIKAMNL